MAGSRTDTAHTGRWAWAAAGVCAAVLLAATLEVVLDAAVGHSPLIPGSPGIAGWLAWVAKRLGFIGIGERLGFRMFLIALLSFTGAYAGLLALDRPLLSAHRADRRATTWAIALVVALT